MGKALSTDFENKATSSIRWTTLGEILAKLIVPITNMILARLLAPEVFGLVASISVVTNFAEIVSESGFSRYILQQKFASQEKKRQSAGTSMVVSVALSCLVFLIVVLCRDPLAKLVNAEGYGTVLVFAAAQIPFYAVVNIQIALFRRDFKFKKLAIVRFSSCAAQLLVSVICAALGAGIWSIPAGTLGNLAFQFILLLIFDRKSFVFSFSRQAFKEMWSCSGLFLVSSIVVWADSSINTLFAGWFLGQASAGFIRNGFNTASSIISMLTAIYSPVLISLLAKMEPGTQEYKLVFYKYQKGLSVLLVPLGIGMLVFQNFLTLIFFGDGWEPAAIALGWQGLIGCIRLVSGNFIITAWSAEGKPLWIILSDVLSTICMSIVWVALRGFNYHIIIIFVCLGLLPTNFLCLSLCKKTLKLSPWPVLGNMFKAVLPAVLMGLVGYFLITINDNFWLCIVYVLFCIIYYFVWIVIVFPDFLQALLEVFVSNKIPKFIKKDNPYHLAFRA